MRRDSARVSSGKGMILITTLWILVILAFLAMNLSYRVRLNLALMSYRTDELDSRLLLQSGLARAMTAIRNDADVEVDFGGETWREALPMTSEGLVPVKYLNQDLPAVRWVVNDEESKLNVNCIDTKILFNLLTIYYESNVDAEAISEYIMDWVDEDSEGPAEDEYYMSLSSPYPTRSGEMEYMEELMAVREVIPRLYYGEDHNGNGIPDPSEDDGERRPPDDNMDGILQPGLRDILTCYTDGTLNVNTAPLGTLQALFRTFVEAVEADTKAGELDKARSGPDGITGNSDDTAIGSTERIAEIVGQTLYQQCKNAGVPLGTSSTAFTISVYVTLESAGIECAGKGLVLRDEQGCRLAYWRPE